MQKVQGSYREMFERVYTENYLRLYCYALHIVNDEEAAKDILNDVFVALVRNRAVDFLRHHVLQHQYTEEYLYTAEQFYADYSDEKDKLVEEMMSQLSPPTDQILEMCYLKRMKYAEVAEALDISPNTVKKHILKALRTLRERYKGKREYPI